MGFICCSLLDILVPRLFSLGEKEVFFSLEKGKEKSLGTRMLIGWYKAPICFVQLQLYILAYSSSDKKL
jgi:hypothetical protein